MVDPTERTLDGSNTIRLWWLRSFVHHLHLQKLGPNPGAPADGDVERNQKRGNCKYVGTISTVSSAIAGISSMHVSFLERCPWLLSVPALPPAPFPLPDSLHGAAATSRAEALMWRSCTVLEHSIATGTVAEIPNKMFMTDYPRQVAGRLRDIFYPDLDALPITPALRIPPFFAALCGPVSLLLFPARPNQSCLPASVTAIPLSPSPWTEAVSTPLKQTKPRSRPTRR